MKLVIGLGNPEKKYRNNRHSVGYVVVDDLKNSACAGRSKNPKIQNSKQFKILKSDKFMNDSGSFVFKNLKTYSIKPEALYIIHDDLDIKLGEYKIQFGKGPKEHKGLVSIYEALGTRNFWHVRVGIENRQQALGTKIKGEDYVLEDFTKEEAVRVEQVVKKVVNDLCKKLAI